MINDVKVVVVGTIGVGKSSLTLRYVQNSFNQFLQSTLGAVYFQKIHTYDHQGKQKSIKYQFWDTAGQQKYRSIAKIYYKDCRVALLVYDITSRQSFEELKIWVQELKDYGPKNALLVIIGNKVDLVKQNLKKQEVPQKQAAQYANSIKAIFQITSAKQGEGLTNLFDNIAHKLQNAPVEEKKTKLDRNKRNGKTDCC